MEEAIATTPEPEHDVTTATRDKSPGMREREGTEKAIEKPQDESESARNERINAANARIIDDHMWKNRFAIMHKHYMRGMGLRWVEHEDDPE